jgi:nitrate reductase NapD
VSSIVITTSREQLQAVIDSLNAFESCEVHFHDSSGKIVITIEGATIDEQVTTLKEIQMLPYVYNANLAYAYCEDELTEARKQIRN